MNMSFLEISLEWCECQQEICSVLKCVVEILEGVIEIVAITQETGTTLTAWSFTLFIS